MSKSAALLLESPDPIVLMGPVPVAEETIAPFLGLETIACDGGAKEALRHGAYLTHVIGDMDSLGDERFDGVKYCTVNEQDSSDFDKALNRFDAPKIFAFGFLGGRVDHSLSAIQALARYPHHMLYLIGDDDVSFLWRREYADALPQGARISFFALGTTTITKAQGFRYSMTGLTLDAASNMSLSNEIWGRVALETRGAPLIATIERGAFMQVYQSLS